MNDKAEEVLALSDDGAAGDCDDGTVSPTPVTVPKKRGRPSNAEKPKKVPTGRGRGRPAKGADKKPVKAAAASADGSDEEGTASDGGSPLPNGDAVEDVSPGRGRQPKGKRKLAHIIEATGKGRGRPKKTKTDVVDDDAEGADDNEDEEASDYKSGKKSTAKIPKKGRGRPKKVQNSDDESSDDKMEDDEERRTVGRPSSGGVNLNIVRTGRGQGRPKKDVAARRAADAENGDGEVSKKRGRPSTSGKAYVPTGKPRGRPKLAVQEDKDSQEDDEEEDAEAEEKSPEKADDNSADEAEEDDKNKSDSEDGI